MMSRWLWLLMLPCAAAVAKQTAPDDFAFGRELRFGRDNALVEVTLPQDVYRAAAHADLRDLRVFNGTGEVLPHVLRLPSQTNAVRVTHTPPVFPIYGAVDQDLASLQMQLRRNAQGRVERIDTQSGLDGSGVDGERRMLAYVIDTTRITVPVSALEFEWTEMPPDFLATVTVEASDYFAHWTDIASNIGIARMEFGGEQLERRRIEFAPRRANFYRVSWPADQPLPGLPVIKFEEAVTAAMPTRLWEQLPTRAGANAGEYIVAVPGQFPIDRMRIRLSPEENRVVKVALYSRASADDSWTPRGSGPVYRLKFGSATVDSADLGLPGAPGREWMLRVTPSEGLEKVEPVVSVSWIPHRLFFEGTGRGPFQLVYGATATSIPESPTSRALAEIKNGESHAAVSPAALGAPITLGGTDRLAPSRWPNWRAWTLFALFLIGVLSWVRWGRRLRLPEMPQKAAHAADG